MKPDELNLIEKEAKELFNSGVVNVFEDLYTNHEQFVNSLIKIIDAENQKTLSSDNNEQLYSFYQTQNDLKSDLFKKYDEYLKNISTEIIIHKYQQSIILKSSEFSPIQILNQTEYNFDKKNVSQSFVKILISLKYKTFKLFGFFAGLFKRNTNKDSYAWKRKIPFVEMINYFYAHKFTDLLEPLIKELVINFGKNLVLLNNETTVYSNTIINYCFTEQSVNKSLDDSSQKIKNILAISKNELKQSIDQLNSSAENQINDLTISISEEYKIVGTISRPFKSYSSAKNEKYYNKIRKRYLLVDKNTRIYLKSIFNKYEFLFNVISFQYLIISKSFYVISRFKKELDSQMNFIMESFDEVINKTISDLKGNSNSIDEVSNLLSNKKVVLHEKIDGKLIIDIVEILNKVNYTNQLTEFENIIESSANVFSKGYLFVKHKDLEYGLQEKDQNKFVPYKIVDSLFLSPYSSFIKNQSNESIQYYNAFKTKIINLGQVTEYNLDAASDQLTSAGINACLELAEEGLVRVTNRKKDAYSALLESLENQISLIRIETEELLKNTSNLKNTEEIINLKIRAAKERTFVDLNNLYNDLFNKSKTNFKRIYSNSTLFINSSLSKYSKLKSKVGLADKENEISESISEYLSDTASSLETIPPVYKNLFSNSPIYDDVLFVGRTNEIEKFEHSYKKWYSGKLSSVVIVGEKGSGTSSLFNIVRKSVNSNINLYRREFSTTISNEMAFVDEMSKLLKFENVTSVSDIIDQINKFEKRAIVLIENLEDFYLKTINGFVPIHSLIEIIAATHDNVFWVATCAKYSWNYLVKTVNIQDYFVFKIELTEISDHELEQIILKRHNISGYNLIFTPTIQDESAKSYKKLPEEDRVVYLREKYFETITKLTQGNIALSLFLWMRSINKIDNDSVYVSTSIDIDFSFLNDMPDTKIFSIAVLILHDGLNIDEHSRVLNISNSKSKLIFDSLIEDGIIFKRNDKYKINFQLYRPLVNLLKNRNIFH